ncbi:2-amino-4-hydroxy-6-hydroxymethyldihydropteridine diphosphokinase [Candidatus Pantoea edessiphila]|uniref:2-amino-4-hydroxy-6-hydroxymethyldihydropteridine pyrophosphokinase n=1 Tax=Candidatus Pantoea edessiphila TaxID=2044610 RepID=A0A2P5T070_9GAMM|nr:2-amino-4-hydroxy-6-hydroxymethyldihydropteridine diphosphokinase [Candidatus Pantoea edessiphila]PPI87988.1 2-amino-4-hydroxy-6-hydroxymethyldihydropteridine diphosphokinase [Candidatus Pantoea edessiphila]
MSTTYLALGSNLNHPMHQIKTALKEIDKIPKTKRIATSQIYCTLPYGLKNQDNYLNMVVALKTKLSPNNLLKLLQEIELKQGRIRYIERWGPRTIDIDIMLFENKLINTNDLIIPHYDMINRVFMLLPLVQISPNIILPNGKRAKDILVTLDTSTIKICKI